MMITTAFPTPTSLASPPPAIAPSLADVTAHLDHAAMPDATRIDYRRAVGRCVRLHDDVALGEIPADVAAFKRRWPRDSFDPRHFKSLKACQAWRRKVIAAIKHMLRAAAPKPLVAAASGVEDAWNALIGRIEPHTGTTFEGAMHPASILISIRKLAEQACAADVPPDRLSAGQVVIWSDPLTPNERASRVRALRTLDALRYLPEIAEMLPAAPFGSAAVSRRASNGAIPPALLAQADAWVAASTDGVWDPIDEMHSGGHKEGSRGVYASAIRRYLAEVARIGEVDLARVASFAELFAAPIFVKVVRVWRDTAGARDALSPRSAARYVLDLALLLEQQGLDAAHLRHALKHNRFLSAGKASDKMMAPRTRRFCEGVLRNPETRRTFQTQHLRYRKEACEILERAPWEKLSKTERARVIQLGACAAVSAIELYGRAPRIENILSIPMKGAGRWLWMPDDESADARFAIPKECVKNGKDLSFKLKPNKSRALEVLEWYVEHVRPKILDGASSDFLFPNRSGGKLARTTFGGWLKTHSARIGVPMTAHLFRAGVVSLLYDRYPTLFEKIAKFIGDHPRTIRTYYAWIDEDKSTEEIQARLLEIAQEKNEEGDAP